MSITIDDIKIANAAAGQYWFSPDTMGFFNSVIETDPIVHNGRVFFVSSERYDDRAPKLYTIREFQRDSGCIDTVGTFQAFDTCAEAETAIEEI